MVVDRLLVYCRAGFEGECAAELQQRAAELGVQGYARARPGEAQLSFVVVAGDPVVLYRQLSQRLIFARQLLLSAGECADLPASDRIAPVLAAVRTMTGPVSEVWVETADTNEGKALAGFCRKFTPPLRAALGQAGLLRGDRPALPRLHLLVLDGSLMIPALSLPGCGSPWPMGIPRLKLPRAAPSRSTLKLDEALQVLLSARERERWLRPGMRAVDLGAAPGGWTWQLVRRHLQVVAVDNGALAPTLLESGLVEHRREDGFRFRPRRSVDWLVCDMVEQPIRIARLSADWLARGDCRHCIVNLKLPMKRRFQEVTRCLAEIRERCGALPLRLRVRQLYHDREEVTAYLGRVDER